MKSLILFLLLSGIAYAEDKPFVITNDNLGHVTHDLEENNSYEGCKQDCGSLKEGYSDSVVQSTNSTVQSNKNQKKEVIEIHRRKGKRNKTKTKTKTKTK